MIPIYYYLGIDPGASGGAALVSDSGELVYLYPWKKLTPTEMAELIRSRTHIGHIKAAIEKVHSMPKQGVASTFAFGTNFGWWQGLLCGLEIPLVEMPSPQRWQKDMGCLSGGDKNVTKAKSHAVFPHRVKDLTHATADAALIALWLQQTKEQK